MTGRCLLILWAVMCWQSHLILLLKGRKSIAGHLIRKIEENGDCLDTGFLTTPYLLDALCKIGRMDKAYKILLQTKCPSWLYEVKQGSDNNLGKLHFLQGGRGLRCYEKA